MDNSNARDVVNGSDVEDIENPSSAEGAEQTSRQQRQQQGASIMSRSSSSLNGSRRNISSSSSMPSQYPAEFYCPLSKELMKDPVVLVDGLSYERASVEASPSTVIESSVAATTDTVVAVESTNNSTEEGDENDDVGGLAATSSDQSGKKMYSNRALKTIITESTQTTFQKIQNSAKQFLGGEIVKGNSIFKATLSGGFYCPITLGIIHVPMIDPEGYTYEQNAIESWIQVNGDSPVTREPLSIEDLIPNFAILNLLEAEANRKDEENIHPAILKWKNESPPIISLEMSSRTTTQPGIVTGGEAAVGTDGMILSNNTVAIPLTREELERQQQMAERDRRVRKYTRLSFVVVALGVIIAGFFVPILAAVALVMIMVGICLVTRDSMEY